MMAISLGFKTFPSLSVYYLATEGGGALVLIVPKPMPMMKMATTKPPREALGCWKVGGVVIPVRVTWLALGDRLV